MLRALARIALGCGLAFGCSSGSSDPGGRLDLRILDGGHATPARIELVDTAGKAWVAPDAIAVTSECMFSPPPEWLRAGIESRAVHNRYTGHDQFYAAGHADLALPSGRYELRVFKGNEYRTARRTIEIAAGETRVESVALERWIDPAREGWIGADDHIHITRLSGDNPRILAWMEAEGMSVANLLQMGTADQFGVTPQYAFGDAGVYGDGATRLFAGQEHPRTHLLGHTITLGAREAIDLRESYIVYEGFWRESARLGGVSGFAHYGQGPAADGLALSAPDAQVHFIEVLQSEYLAQRIWYELLDMGFRIAPSAGTDWPCIPSLPGRERTYVGIDGDLTREAFVAGIRAGRTFVTNGPVVDLRASTDEAREAGIGAVIELPGPASVHVEGRVRFDPDRDHIAALELVVGGRVVRVADADQRPGEMSISSDVPIHHSTWVALRASGHKLDEIPVAFEPIPEWADTALSWWGGGWSFEGRGEFLAGLQHRPSLAHSGAIYVEVAGRPNPAAAAMARSWLARLDDLAARLGDERIDELAVADGFPYSDGVSVEHVRSQRARLEEAIARSRAHFEKLASRAGDFEPRAE